LLNFCEFATRFGVTNGLCILSVSFPNELYRCWYNAFDRHKKSAISAVKYGEIERQTDGQKDRQTEKQIQSLTSRQKEKKK
jgi:hypothetical protein